MSIIDKSMYEKLENWCGRNRPKNQYMMYVNSCDRGLTDATVRKLMFDIDEEDTYGDGFISYYSANNFYNNMREYYSHIAKLYMKKPADDEPLEEMIKRFPSTCDWITLIVEDIEVLSDDKAKMEEVFKLLLSFACKRPNIILIGNGDYTRVFSKCEFALQEMADGIAAKPEENLLMIGLYDQEETSEKEHIVYDSEEKHRNELSYYWRTVYNQLKKGYFDYNNFKSLIKETLEYLIPRVTKEQVYRKDLYLIEHIGRMCEMEHKTVEGCMPWEFDAAGKIAEEIHFAIVNMFDQNDDFSSGKIEIDVSIKQPDMGYGGLLIRGSLPVVLSLSVDNISSKMDLLARSISRVTYTKEKNDTLQLFNDNVVNAIKEAADKTVNKDAGMKVRRHTSCREDASDFSQTEKEKGKLRILERKYDISADKIKGSEKLNPEQTADIVACKLIRYISVLDETGYIINADGNAEMTKASQREYDDYVSQLRQMVMSHNFTVLDEGYGCGEDELEWHISFMTKASDEKGRAVLEIDTCVRTAEPACI